MDYSQFLLLKEELSLILVIVILFVADLFMSPDAHKNDGKPVLNTMLPVALLTIHTLITIVPGPVADAFGGMYHNQPIQSIVKSILSIGTLIVFLMAHEWMRRPDTAIKQGEFYITDTFHPAGYVLHDFCRTLPDVLHRTGDGKHPDGSAGCLRQIPPPLCRGRCQYILTALFSSGLLLYGLSFDLRYGRHSLFCRHTGTPRRQPVSRLWHSYSSSPAWDSKYHWCLSIFGQQTFTKVLQVR